MKKGNFSDDTLIICICTYTALDEGTRNAAAKVANASAFMLQRELRELFQIRVYDFNKEPVKDSDTFSEDMEMADVVVIIGDDVMEIAPHVEERATSGLTTIVVGHGQSITALIRQYSCVLREEDSQQLCWKLKEFSH